MYRSMEELYAGSIDWTQWLPTSCSGTLEHWNVAVGAASDAVQKHVSVNHHIHRRGRQALSTYRVVKLSYCQLYTLNLIPGITYCSNYLISCYRYTIRHK